MMNISTPLDIPNDAQNQFLLNRTHAQNMAGRTCMLSCDQLIEHLYDDLLPEVNKSERADPSYFFELAHTLQPELFAIPVGLLSRYATHYPTLPYVAKLTGKSNAAPHEEAPYSAPLFSVDQVCRIRDMGARVIGVGATIYLGSTHESRMLETAARTVSQAHAEGLLAILWVYVRSQAIQNEQSGPLTAGCTAIATSLGADFVKIKPPIEDGDNRTKQWLTRACTVAGSTRVLISGGPQINTETLLRNISSWVTAGAAGIAIGRNLFQRPLDQAQQLYAEMQHILLTEKQHL